MAMPAPVKIFGENFLHPACTVTASTGAEADCLCDGNPRTVWRSSGSNDTVAETITAGFATQAGTECSVMFDRIILQNTNAARISAVYITPDNTCVAIPEAALDGIIADSVIIELPQPVTAKSVTLTLHATQTADDEKYLGGLKFCKSIMSLSNTLTAFSRSDYVKQGDYYLASGSLVHWREYRKAGGTLCVENLTLADRNTLNQAINAQEFLTVSFLDDVSPGEVYEFFVSSAPSEEFDRTTMRYTCEFQVKER
ncbi:MAG: hypothetical protein PHW69_02655 [Elusimicrobiaceae bacterium]|nr:hypothetical protein [Elusimicrobiaceae bacterium]